MELRSDQQLLEEHLAGNSASFAALAERYAHELYAFLCRFVGDPSAADDLVQETFLQVHHAGRAYDPARPFKPWLYTVAANKARDYLRSRTRRQERSLDAQSGGGDDGAALAESVEADAASVEDEFDSADQRARVREVIAQMPEHLRLILMLGYYQQLPYAEIAEILGIPVGTVKSRLHSAVGAFGKLWRRSARSASPQA